MNLAGSLFHIADINVRPAIGQITLSAQGELSSGLKALDIPKFRYIEKFGKTTDVANGHASVLGWLQVPLIKGAKQSEIKFDIAGTASNVISTKLIKGRKLTAKQVAISARDVGISMSGDAVVDGVPASFDWTQSFVDNPEKRGNLNSRDHLKSIHLGCV